MRVVRAKVVRRLKEIKDRVQCELPIASRVAGLIAGRGLGPILKSPLARRGEFANTSNYVEDCKLLRWQTISLVVAIVNHRQPHLGGGARTGNSVCASNTELAPNLSRVRPSNIRLPEGRIQNSRVLKDQLHAAEDRSMVYL